MKRTTREPSGLPTRMSKFAWIVLTIPTLALVAVFQNCSKVEFQSAVPSKASVPGEKESQFAELTAGDAKAFPPLKLVFVVDNSGTMQVNQISLASAFGKMFEGDNATNLAPFDSTALVINTAQRSIAAGDSLFPRIPERGVASLSQLPLSDLRALRGGAVSDGKLAGDLAGYAAEVTVTDQLKTLSYLPAPVLGLDGSSVQVGVRKLSGGSVSDFSKSFSDRIAVLDPARSAIDPVTRTGILDPVVDQESGLCSIARMLKNNGGLLNKGDLAAFVIVSDENDADPSGRNCIDKYVDYRGTEDLIDGRCEQPRTTLSYFKAVANPSTAKCKVDFRTGLKFEYTYPYVQTKVSYLKKRYQYDQARTRLNYKVSTYTLEAPKTNVSYFTKNPTYKVARTNVTYSTKVETCDTRDGIKVNCTYSYPTATVTVDGSLQTATCTSLSANKLPAAAILNDPARPLACTNATPRVVTGACSTELDCNQNYAAATQTLTAKLASNSTCAAFVQGKLNGNAVYADSDVTKLPKCVDATSRTNAANGRCLANSSGCVEVFTAKVSDLNGKVTTTCEAFARSNLSASAGVVYGASANDNPVCTALNPTTPASDGTCPSSLPADRSNCKEVAGINSKDALYPGAPAANQTCDAYLTSKAPSDRSVLGGAPTCVTSTESRTQTGTQNYTNNVMVNYVPQKGDACSAELQNLIRSKNSALPAATTCKISDIVTASETIDGKSCTAASPVATCTGSNGAKRECVTSDIAPGAKFETTVTNATLDEALTCNTSCSDTKLCKEKSGTVADNFNSCKVSIASAATVKTFQKELLSNKPSLCAAGQTVVQTKGPYREEGTVTKYVAGEASEKNEPNALANYIKARSTELFGSTAPAVSVFVRQQGDALGTNGTLGTNYNAFANLMDGQKRSVLSNADSYATSLQSLSGVIRTKLDRAFSISGFQEDQQVLRAWHRAAGTQEWIEASEGVDWTASGGTVTLSQSFDVKFGDQFRFEYK